MQLTFHKLFQSQSSNGALKAQCPLCNKCNLRFVRESISKCSNCEGWMYEYKFCKMCDFKICDKCVQKFMERNHETENPLNTGYYIIIFIFGLIVTYYLYQCIFQKEEGLVHSSDVKLLKHQYPSQKLETWPHVLSVLDTRFPTVKSITLLHSDDKRTSDCLAKHLVSIFNKDTRVPMEDITFHDIAVDDYGQVLEYYLPIVRKHRAFVTDLSTVPSNIARIFHSLCDEVSSDIKPSLFIFTLFYNKNVGNLKPIEIATSVLKKAWANLPQNEIEPLLSRVVKNVIDVIPEKNLSC